MHTRRALALTPVVALAACGRLAYGEQDTESESMDAALDASVHLDVGHVDAGDVDAAAVDAPFDDDAFAPDAVTLDVADDAFADDAFAPADTNEPDSGMVFVAPCPLDALFCDGYDDPTLSAWSYSVIHDGIAERAFEPIHGGVASLHCQTDGTVWTEARWSADVFGAQTSGDLWTRAFFYLPTGVGATFSVESISERAPPYAGVLVLFQGDQIGVRVGAAGPLSLATDAFPRDRWVCVEMHLEIAATGRAELFLDGAPAATVIADTSLATGYDIAEIGLHFSPAGNPVELWVDDVALSRTRPGCP